MKKKKKSKKVFLKKKKMFPPNHKLYFYSNFRLSAKLRGKHDDCPHHPVPTKTQSPPLNHLQKNVAFVTTNEPALTQTLMEAHTLH